MTASAAGLRLADEAEARIDDLQRRYPTRAATLLHVLWEIQWQEGWISEDWMRYAASRCGVPESKVLGVISFYTMFRTRPFGRWHVQVCRNICCHIMGGRRIIDHVKGRLGLDHLEVSPDGHWSFEEVECMAACSWAPMMAVNETFHENLTVEKVDRILDDPARAAGGDGP
jgi:NADH-quinone oxidoreductase subunit E